jgi:anhydro-N-acetylmuramic acid kinase
VAWFVGLMSGTSLDGVDGVLAEAPPGQLLQARAHVHRPFDAALRASLLYLNTAPVRTKSIAGRWRPML